MPRLLGDSGASSRLSSDSVFCINCRRDAGRESCRALLDKDLLEYDFDPASRFRLLVPFSWCDAVDSLEFRRDIPIMSLRENSELPVGMSWGARPEKLRFPRLEKLQSLLLVSSEMDL